MNLNSLNLEPLKKYRAVRYVQQTPKILLPFDMDMCQLGNRGFYISSYAFRKVI
jgi:hypothetical protein